jgi:hypothetical protein
MRNGRTRRRSIGLAEITRVNFGGDYENALHLAGGDPVVESSGRGSFPRQFLETSSER